jgi:hypothetical protein
LQQATHLLLCPKHVCADVCGHDATALLWMLAACTGMGNTERRRRSIIVERGPASGMWDWSAHHALVSATLPVVVASVVRRGSSRRAVQCARQHVPCHLWLSTVQQQAAGCVRGLLCCSGGVPQLPSTTREVWMLYVAHSEVRVHPFLIHLHYYERGVKRGQLRPAPLSPS